MKYEKLRPNSVRIMGRNYVVVYEEDSLLGQEALGLCNNHQCIIVVKENQHPIEELDTLIHEILHALFYCMDVDTKDEESIVRKLSSGLVSVMMDNPKLMKYINAIENPPHLEL